MKIKLIKERSYYISPYTIAKFLTFGGEVTPALVENLQPLSDYLQRICKLFAPKDKVVIHNYDLWNLDYSLAHIILPSLKLLKINKGGAPFVDDNDVPDKIKSIKDPDYVPDEFYVDIFFQDRWDYVIDEMIFAFDSIVNCEVDYELDNETFQNRVNNGLRLFGKYYQNLWT